MSPPPTPPPPGPPPPPPVAPPLVRRSGDRVVAGVCAGLGRRFGLDPVLVRILFIATMFAGLVAIPIYLVLWFALPQVDEPAPQVGTPRPQGVAVGLAAVVIVVAALVLVWNLPTPGVVIPLVLIAVGVALWQRPSQAMASHASPAPGDSSARVTSRAVTATSTDHPTRSSEQPMSVPATATIATTPPPPPARGITWWRPPAPRPSPSWLGPATLAVAFLAAGVVAGLGVADVLVVDASDVVATVLVVLAAGLVVSAFRGRARWLAIPATACLVALVAMELALGMGLRLDPGIGERRIVASQVADGTSWRHGLGNFEIDLGQARVDGVAMEVHLTGGNLELTIPWDADVVLTGEVGVGQVEFHDAIVSDEGGRLVTERGLGAGTLIELDTTLESQVADPQVLELQLRAGAANVEIWRARPDGPMALDPDNEATPSTDPTPEPTEQPTPEATDPTPAVTPTS